MATSFNILKFQMYPLRFEPLFRRYLWGGHRLGEVLGKPIGDQSAAESWEIVDHGRDQSVVRNGPFAGQTLRELIAKHGGDLLGQRLLDKLSSPAVPAHLQSRFPLLLKFLDANQPLSVQVHPDDCFAATLVPPDLGKTEAWYIMHADPGARIYAGLERGVTKAEFDDAVRHDKIESVLHCFEPKRGECVFIRAGTIHAIGAGLVIAEIQQASDTTFRVSDWGRVDSFGNPRPLHIEQAMEATDFALGPVNSVPPTSPGENNQQTLISCDKFVMNRYQPTEPMVFQGNGGFRILTVTKGSVRVIGEPSNQLLGLAETVLLPACLKKTEVIPAGEEVELLEIYVPDPT